MALAVLLATFISSCSEDAQLYAPLLEDGLNATLESPVCDEELGTKALSDKFEFAFEQGDQVNVFLKSSSDEAMIYKLSPYKDEPTTAKFNVKSFYLNNDTYVAIYPSQIFTLGSQSIGLSFAGQNQSTNGSTEHLSAYDYCWAEATIANNSGNFAFKHKVAWIKVTVPVSEATTLKYLSVRADEGVASSATINVSTGAVTTSRSAGDTLRVALGGNNGIAVQENGTLTAFITVPAESYTNLSVLAFDADGNAYSSSHAAEVTLAAGKYYSMTLYFDGLVPFTETTEYGAYVVRHEKCSSEILTYDDTAHQMSCGGGSGYIDFKIAGMASGEYAAFKVSSATITEGDSYSVTANVNGTTSTGTYVAVKKTADRLWLLNSSANSGYIIAIE